MGKLKVILPIILVVWGLTLPPTVWADGRGRGGRHGGGESEDSGSHRSRGSHGANIYDHLNLSSEQQMRLESNKQRYRQRRQEVEQRIQNDSAALDVELRSPNTNRERVQELRSRVKSAQQEMEDERVNSVMEVKQILTPQQFEEFISYTEDR